MDSIVDLCELIVDCRKVDFMAKKRRVSKFFLMSVILVGSVVALLFSPLFRINQIDIIGNNVLSNREIMEASRLLVGGGMFTFRARPAAARVVELPFAGVVTVSRHLPDRVVITVEERVPVANILLGMTTYLMVDADGMVLEANRTPAEGLPQVTGLEFTNFAVGQPLRTEQNIIFSDILLLSRIFNDYGFLPDSVDFTNPRAISIMYEDFTISFGSMEDAAKKVRNLVSIINELALLNLNTGFVDVRDINDNPRFRLTRN